MSEKKWKLIKSTPVVKSKWLSIFKNDYKLPNGCKVSGYYHLSRPNYVLIIAIDKDKKIILEKNYRRGVDDFVYELPAGWIEKGEFPKKAAQRELSEETGFVGEVKIIGKVYPQPGFSSMVAFVGVAKIDKSKMVEKKLDPDEIGGYELVALKKVYQMIENGRIKDMGLLSSLQLANKFLKSNE